MKKAESGVGALIAASSDKSPGKGAVSPSSAPCGKGCRRLRRHGRGLQAREGWRAGQVSPCSEEKRNEAGPELPAHGSGGRRAGCASAAAPPCRPGDVFGSHRVPLALAPLVSRRRQSDCAMELACGRAVIAA